MPDAQRSLSTDEDGTATAVHEGSPRAHPGELARAQARVRFLERQCDYLVQHARNIEIEVRRLRRLQREASVDRHHLEPDEGFWRRRYEEVVNSWSWRFMWWLATPYRAAIGARRKRQRP